MPGTERIPGQVFQARVVVSIEAEPPDGAFAGRRIRGSQPQRAGPQLLQEFKEQRMRQTGMEKSSTMVPPIFSVSRYVVTGTV